MTHGLALRQMMSPGRLPILGQQPRDHQTERRIGARARNGRDVPFQETMALLGMLNQPRAQINQVAAQLFGIPR